jgi:hypothetical protein
VIWKKFPAVLPKAAVCPVSSVFRGGYGSDWTGSALRRSRISEGVCALALKGSSFSDDIWFGMVLGNRDE